MRTLWIEFADEETAWRQYVLGLCGCFDAHVPTPCSRPAEYALSINIGVGDKEIDLNVIRRIPRVIDCGFCEETKPPSDPIEALQTIFASALAAYSDIRPDY